MRCLAHLLLLSLLFSLKVKEILGVVTNLDCDGVDNTYTASGTSVTFTCDTQTSAIGWVATGISASFGSINDDTGDTISMGGFTANYTQEGPPGMSTLDFYLTPSLNGTTVTCDDGGLTGPMSCFILVIVSPQSPLSVTTMSRTNESVELQWSAPSFNGGSDIIRYHISVSPPPTGPNCNGGQCTTGGDVTSYTVTGLTPNVQYTFNVSAENSEGIGDGAVLNVTTIGNVFGIPDQPDVCLNYSDNGDLILAISWNCDAAAMDPTTPPLTGYTLCIDSVCSQVPNVSCRMYMSKEVICNDIHTVNITFNNEVGPSEPSVTDTINTNLLTSLMHKAVTNESVNITYTPFSRCNNFESIANLAVNLTNMNTSDVQLFNNTMYTSREINIGSLDNNTLYSYSVMVTVNGMDICNGTYVRNRLFMTLLDGEGDDMSSSPTPTPTTTPTNTSTSTVTLSSSTSSTPSPTITSNTGYLPTGAIIGIAVGGALILLGIIILLIVLCFCLKSNRGEKGSEEPIALVNRTDAVPETGQALYQDPDTIKREEAPTGDLYALPDKPRRNAPTTPPAHAPEMATYQDPNTIQREQAPTGDLYALPEKKPVYSQVNKEKTGIVYAELGLDNTNSAGPGRTNEVLYSDVNVQ